MLLKRILSYALDGLGSSIAGKRDPRTGASLRAELDGLQAAEAIEAITIDAMYRLLSEIGRDPTPEELAYESGLSLDDVLEAQMVNDSVSLEAPVGEDGAVLGDFVAHDDEDDPGMIHVCQQTCDTIRDAPAAKLDILFGCDSVIAAPD